MSHRAPVIISAYNEAWPVTFTEERYRLAALFPPEAGFHIEHVGSTAVRGLAAKPIIDVMLGAPLLEQIESRIEGLVRLGYEYIPRHEQSFPQRRFFAKPIARPRNFHLHGVVFGETFWNEHIAFRDALRSCEALAFEYESLKRRLAAEFGDDREGYTNAKSDFISQVVQHAMRLVESRG